MPQSSLFRGDGVMRMNSRGFIIFLELWWRKINTVARDATCSHISLWDSCNDETCPYSQFCWTNRIVWRITGPKWEEVTGDCRRLNNEEVHNLYATPNSIRMINSRRIRWAGHVALHREVEKWYQILFTESHGKRQVARLENNIKSFI
jgi:hypothetical protein